VIPVVANLGIVLLAFSSEKKAALLVLGLLAIGVILAPIAIRGDAQE
jgi:hypothetical protein